MKTAILLLKRCILLNIPIIIIIVVIIMWTNYARTQIFISNAKGLRCNTICAVAKRFNGWTRKIGVVGSNPALVTIKIRLVRKATGNRLLP